jgi:hypothetical protein
MRTVLERPIPTGKTISGRSKRNLSSYFYSLNVLIYAATKLHRIMTVNNSERIVMKTFYKNSLE